MREVADDLLEIEEKLRDIIERVDEIRTFRKGASSCAHPLYNCA